MSPFRPLRALAYVYIAVFRALSLYIYVLWIYFGIAGAIGINFSPLTAGVIALTCMNSAYMAEIYRSALGSVDPGQREAATSLGFGRVRGFVTVIFPQGMRIAIPSLINQFVDIVKDSSIVSIIGTADLFGVTNRLVSYYRAPFELYTLVAFFYLTLVLAISALAAVARTAPATTPDPMTETTRSSAPGGSASGSTAASRTRTTCCATST